MAEQIVVHPYNGILLSIKMQWTTDTRNNLDVSQAHNAEWKKANLKIYNTTHDSIFIAILEEWKGEKKENSSRLKILPWLLISSWILKSFLRSKELHGKHISRWEDLIHSSSALLTPTALVFLLLEHGKHAPASLFRKLFPFITSLRHLLKCHLIREDFRVASQIKWCLLPLLSL